MWGDLDALRGAFPISKRNFGDSLKSDACESISNVQARSKLLLLRFSFNERKQEPV